jgi:hypothetical protein
MMLSHTDIYRAAHVLMHEFGNDAECEAARCVNRTLWSGNHDAVLNWFRIWRTIALMRTTASNLPN